VLQSRSTRERGVSEQKFQDYATFLDIKFDPLTLIDVNRLVGSVTDKWYNQTLCKVNDSVVRLGVMQGEYHWHKHERDDEFFYVLSGRFIVDLEDRSVELLPNQGLVVPRGVMHCTRAPERSVILMVETAAIVPTGDA
jgi:mannose-6-phosphate isomerase-like protein (cupin superfamily)